MIALFPRLSAADSITRMDSFVSLTIEAIAEQADSRLAGLRTTNAAVGGSRVALPQLREIQSQLRDIASQNGYPRRGRLEDQQRFDLDTAAHLRSIPGFVSGEGIRAETWQYVAAGLLPDVVYWRWRDGDGEGPVSPARFLGGNRNCFGRLWQRAVVFTDERIEDPNLPLTLLREDNFAAILERSAFAAQPGPCREIARAFLLRRELARDKKAGRTEEDFLRDAMRRTTRVAAHRALWALEEADLREVVARLMDESLRAMGATPQSESTLLARQPGLRVVGGVPPSIPLADIEDTSRSPSSITTRASQPEPLEAQPPFADLATQEQVTTVWDLLIGHGALRQEELVRIAAFKLRERGQVHFERLREGGQVFTMVQEAIERGVRGGRFDKPQRGYRRAVAASPTELPPEIVRNTVLMVAESGCAAGDVVGEVATELGTIAGLGASDELDNICKRALVELETRGEVRRRGSLLYSQNSGTLPSADSTDAASDDEGSDQHALALAIGRDLGIEMVDRTHIGGALWFVADEAQPDLEERLRSIGLQPRFASSGSGSTGRRPAWWVRVE